MNECFKIKHPCEIIDLEVSLDNLNWNQIVGFMMQGKTGALHAPFCPAGPVPVPFHMQLVVVERETENNPHQLSVLKYFYFEDKHSPDVVKPLLHGAALTIDWGANTRNGPKGFQHMLDMLGGLQVRAFVFDGAEADAEVGKAAKFYNKSAINVAFDFIESNGPRNNGRNSLQCRWVKEQMNDPDGPILQGGF